MFQDVGSKVAEEVKLFKTYHPYRKKKKVDDGVDYLINKVQGEIEENKRQNLNNINIQNQEHYIPEQNNQPMNQNYNINNNQYEPPNNELNAQPEPVA